MLFYFLISAATRTARTLPKTFISKPHNHFSITAALSRTMAYSVQESGAKYSLDYKLYFRKGTGKRSAPISPFHDIPLYADKEKEVYNMVVEIPRWSNAKMEISTKEKLNPIKQDVKKGKLRYVSNIFPYKGYIWNYGALPQTWEDPEEKDVNTGFGGDNDPIDVCEIGSKVADRGEVKQVKLLGVMALIDEGETDWKVLAIDVNDPLAESMNDIEDIRKHMPGLIEATHEWFKIYKMPTGKPANKFAFEGKAKGSEFAKEIVKGTHESWKNLVNNKKSNSGELACENVTQESSKISEEEAEKILSEVHSPKPSQSIPEEADKWHFLSDARACQNGES